MRSVINALYTFHLAIIYEEILLYHFPEFRKEYESKIQNGESVYKEIIGDKYPDKVTFIL